MEVSSCIDKILRGKLLWPYIKRMSEHFFPTAIRNINIDLTKLNQKKALIAYTSMVGVDIENIPHANLHHLNQMIYCLVHRDYCIDLCRYDDVDFFEENKATHYDVLIGMGAVYKKFVQQGNVGKKILFLTENDPKVVVEKYNERIVYFMERHPQLSAVRATVRQNCFDREMISLSDAVIVMNSDYNASTLYEACSTIYTINSNALFNSSYHFCIEELEKEIEQTKLSFVIFGVNGLIHKGLDILIDVFEKLPECTLNVYGISSKEKHLFEKLSRKNTIDCGSVNVLSDAFISEVVKKNSFVILDSCSEGMSTGVATCMAHGLIPIVTKETGFIAAPCIFELPGYKVEDVLNYLKNRILSMNNNEVLRLREATYSFAHENFNICKFTERFNSILDKELI